MKNIKRLLLCVLCFSFIAAPVYADTKETEAEMEEALDQEYFIDDDGSIVADFLTDEEVLEIEQMRSQNEKEVSEEVPEAAVTYAVSKAGFPYSNARRHSGSAYDCSSLIYYAYLNAGVDLSFSGMDTAAAIANGLVIAGKEIAADEIEPGDLIFYSNNKNGRYHNITHVSMYIGDGLQIEASSGKMKVAVRAVSFQGAVNVCRPSIIS